MECVEGKHGDITDEVKVALLSFQNTLSGMCPNFILEGNPKTINDSNEFFRVALYICEETANQDVNAVILNELTDVFSCKLEWNKTMNLA